MRAVLLSLSLLFACRSGAPPLDGDAAASRPPAQSADTGAAETATDGADGSDSGDGGSDGDSDDGGDSAEPACDEEGEACELYDDGTSSCCMGRHTCFPEGCYYSLPG